MSRQSARRPHTHLSDHAVTTKRTNFHSDELSPTEETSTSQAALGPPPDVCPLLWLGAATRFLDWFSLLVVGVFVGRRSGRCPREEGRRWRWWSVACNSPTWQKRLLFLGRNQMFQIWPLSRAASPPGETADPLLKIFLRRYLRVWFQSRMPVSRASVVEQETPIEGEHGLED